MNFLLLCAPKYFTYFSLTGFELFSNIQIDRHTHAHEMDHENYITEIEWIGTVSCSDAGAVVRAIPIE